MAQSTSTFTLWLIFLYIFSFNATAHQSHARFHKRSHGPPTCVNPTSPFDYSAKPKHEARAPVCPHIAPRALQPRAEEDFSCSESKPCKNGACCPKATGYCNYGEKYCGTNGQSPNEVCWSNCDAKAECGRDSKVPGAKCPLNVCCSKFGFCGMTDEFCDKGTEEDPGCQSNCEQPGSGGSGGDVQKKVIGYYEAWAHDRKCQGMDFKDIPTGALTHLFFSFGYISPGTFDLVPMDDLDPDLFSKFTDVKKSNPGLKAVIALGGWTFNDNGTATQPVFSDMVSTAANRALFIKKLFAFMRQYAFDGVDFDWEYPGATDRGGKPEDGKNFVTFLKELNEENDKQLMHYVVSFTVPTSFWYLRHFDLKAVDYVDFVNVMSYDLHGVWDATNPIGNNIYGHSNLTEIKLAFDLFWRNNIKPEKLHLGLGFYGRSFQLSDPSCYKPGCSFKGGASPGPCSANSGTLTYKEIQQIIKQHKIKPYYDKDAQVKYITWNQDQWVSYDDKETFKAKIEFANKLGLGGLLIWAIDQDTDDLEALNAVVSPNSIKALAQTADDASFWDDATVPDCYVTDCGGSCKAGFFKIEQQPCGGAKPVTRHSKEKDSQLCCPVSSAPDPDKCHWRGEAATCNGHCHDNEVLLQMNKWGDGKYCEDGNKAYCCESPAAKGHDCYWAGVGKDCNNDDATMTFSGTFMSTVADIADAMSLFDTALVKWLDAVDVDLQKRYCCPKKDAKNWKNCRWYGEPGSCFDNHCPVGKQVQLTDSPYGFGQSCFPRVERTRVYCCDPTDGKELFLPVPLDRLFKDPPTGDDVDTDFELNVDDTFGGQSDRTDEDPSNAAFQFVVLASPEELQHSLDKRDGSHWELYNCEGGSSEEEQTIQMFCTDVSEDSNCHKIGLGHGVPGTILEMPAGCGAGRYAVAKAMTPAVNQTIPHHLRKRASHMPKVYDLTFDYNFRRVPRDVGDTQMRIDFSNKNDYWDNVVAAASTKRKAKRSLSDFGGNHKRWLEEEWRDDYHGGALSREELHKRWFGSDVLAWLTNLVSPKIEKEFTHDVKEQFIAKIIDDEVTCGTGPAKFEAHVLVQALTDVEISTSFGFTLITKLNFDNPGGSLDLSQSYLTFSNNGKITAVFTLEAMIKVSYESGEKTILTLPFPGATFRVPGIVTIGPSVRVVGEFNAGLTLSAEIETKIDLADWDVRQTYPAASTEYEPKANKELDSGETGDKNGLLEPQFYASVLASGKAEAHLKAIAEFGIRFDDSWKVGAATAGVVADGYVRMEVGAGKSTEASCPWTYGFYVGAKLYAQVDTPSAFGWGKKTWDLPGSGEVGLPEGGSCPDLRTGQPTKRSLQSIGSRHPLYDVNGYSGTSDNETFSHRLGKRVTPWGPPFHIPLQDLLCPSPEGSADNTGTACSELSHVVGSDSLSKRATGDRTLHHFEARSVDHKDQDFCDKDGGKMSIRSSNFHTSGTILGVSNIHGASRALRPVRGPKVYIAHVANFHVNQVLPNTLTYGYSNYNDCLDFGFGQIATPTDTTKFATEHILEFQMVKNFFNTIARGSQNVKCYNIQTNINMCKCIKSFWFAAKVADRVTINGLSKDAINWVGAVFPSHENAWGNELVLLDAEVNNLKEGFWGVSVARNADTLDTYTGDGTKAFKYVKDSIAAIRYHIDPTIRARLIAQKDRVGNMLNELETIHLPRITKTIGNQQVTWASLGLQAKWNTYMRTQNAQAITTSYTLVEKYLAKLVDGYTTPAQRDAANRGTPDADILKGLIQKIDALNNDWTNNRPVWNNPF
ncbi:similar to Glycosyl hydrolases family 18 protein [Plenodomus lingam JN3]|uniref:chitinase n=1 Tax=Leptosphaeria maculans (strain JN3 / isolate v23.1.3 / race Av1-4-5-6-7-8) TaxID=985895 RepID=E4ZXI0_LEPMJ|nr:similar to Glycosyl hydrolases family 18 protein [Plenodomus lingam JN3]CBX95390.1 similar to Glycosyl hydrolases family 18 protein [Plenodomus lingam JN3]